MDAQLTSDSHLRSVVKGLSYRVVGTVLTGALSFAITSNLRAAFLIGAAEVTTKLLLFWGHERVWDKLAWGRHRRPVPVVQPTSKTQPTSSTERVVVSMEIGAREG